MPTCRINGQTVTFRDGATILETARQAGIDIPTLCYIKNLNRPAACRMCVVEIEGMAKLMPACVTKAQEGMAIQTESEKVVESRKKTLDLMCQNHRMDCEYCPNYTFCELHALLRRYGVDDRLYSQVYHSRNADETSPCIVRDPSKCVLCRRCVSACQKQGLSVPGPLHRAFGTKIGTIVPLGESDCMGCGQCVRNCPTGALFVRNDSDELLRAVNRKKHIVFGITRHTAENIGRFFGEREPADHMGKLFALLKKAGAEAVFDVTDWGDDTLQSAAKAVKAATGSAAVTRCPAAAKALAGEMELIQIPSTEQVFASKMRTEYASANGLSPEDIFTVYVSPCSAAKREHESDLVLTTTELHAWLMRVCVSKFTLRDVWNKTQPEELPSREEGPSWYEKLRDFCGVGIKLALADGLAQARTLVNSGEQKIAVWACPRGCVNGGGQFRAEAWKALGGSGKEIKQ